MARLPWFAFYPSDWSRDTRCLSLAARGAWIDMLGILWDSKTRGIKSLDMKGWASELGKPLRQVFSVFEELQHRDIAMMVTDGNGVVTVSSRRQVREEQARETTRLRVRRFRRTDCNDGSNGAVTPQKSEVRSQKSEVIQEKKKAPSRKLTDEEFIERLRSNVAYRNITFEIEFGKMDTWLLLHPGRQKTRRFIVSWLNKIDKPMSGGAVPQKKCRSTKDGNCEAYTVSGSDFCQEHKDYYAKIRERKAV